MNPFRVASRVLDGERPPRPKNPSDIFTEFIWSLVTMTWLGHADRPPMSEISAVLQVLNAMDIVEPQMALESTLEVFVREGMENSVASLLRLSGKLPETPCEPEGQPPGLY
jgi:hypothetical protein